MTKGRDLEDKDLKSVSGGSTHIDDKDRPGKGGGGGDQPLNAPTTGDEPEP